MNKSCLFLSLLINIYGGNSSSSETKFNLPIQADKHGVSSVQGIVKHTVTTPSTHLYGIVDSGSTTTYSAQVGYRRGEGGNASVGFQKSW